jgi:hypothetical protein
VRLNCQIKNLPTCAAANTYFSFDRSTDSGKQRLSLVTAAFAAGWKVTGYVHKHCEVWQNNVAALNHLRVTK